MLPQRIVQPLKEHLKNVKIHREDLKNGFGTVYLPYAIERNPNAKIRMGLAICFPATKIQLTQDQE